MHVAACKIVAAAIFTSLLCGACSPSVPVYSLRELQLPPTSQKHAVHVHLL